MAPDVSVVIPAYNSEKTLRPCLRSVLAQTHPPAEIIVVDDRSTDHTREIAREFPIVLIEQSFNRGPAAARNAGVRHSRHPVLFFVDSDGDLAPDAIENALRILVEEPDVGCVHGIYRTEPLLSAGHGTAVESYLLLHHHFWRCRAAGRVRSAFFALAAIRREVFDEIGLFDEKLRASEDVEFSDRMAGRYSIVMTPEVAGRHDDDSRLWGMLGKQFRRSQLLIPVALHERGPAGLRANRPTALLAAALTAATLPLAAVWLPLLTLPVLCAALFVCADPALVRFVRRRRGAAFVPVFLSLHFLIQLAIVGGAVVGGLKHLVDKDFGPSREATV